MSLEDTPKLPVDSMELGDKMFTLPPGKANLIMQLKSEDWYIMNHHKQTLCYYISYTPPNPIHDENAVMVLHIIPVSRREELLPETPTG